MNVRIELLVEPGCPNAEPTEALLRDVAERLVPEADIVRTVVRDAEEAVRLGFPGSPTVRIGGEDLEGPDVGPGAMACRRYEDGAGVPPRWLVEARILRALAPAHLLFLCVANSARSQMAEGIARSLAPDGMQISSAGSAPGGVNPLAVRVLEEIGIDASGHRSKGIDDVAAEAERGAAPPVDAVVTLCAEEVCPIWLGSAARVHWPHPDPAGRADADEGLAAFREVRDELRRKLGFVFPAARAAAGGDVSDPRAPRPESGSMDRMELAIDGMSCDHCTGRVRKALEGVEGVRAAEVTLEPGRAVVEGEGLDAGALASAVTDAGYEARPAG